MRVPVKTSTNTQRASGEKPFIRASGQAGAQSQAALGNALVQASGALGSMGGFLQEQAQQARRFGVLQNFSAFQSSVEERLAELKRNADPAQGNFADQAVAHYSNWEADWLASVPDEFYDEFATRAADVKASVARNSLAFQYESTDNYFRQGVNDQLQRSLLSLDQDGSLDNLETQRVAIYEYINSTTLTEAEKVAKRRQAAQAIESVSYRSEVRRGNLELGALGVGSAPSTASDLIRQYDGQSFENGLDFETNEDLLGQRVQEAEAVAMSALPNAELWSAMPSRARAALISLTDDMGDLPPSVVEAVNSGDLVEVAQAVADLGGERRQNEADIILGKADLPEGRLDADPRFANIPYEDRLALRADAERQAAAEQAEAQKAAKAAQEAQINQLMVGIFDGNAGQYEIDQAREEGWLSDYDAIKKAQDLLDKRNGSLYNTQRMQFMLQQGLTINPASEDDRKMFNDYIGAEGLAAIQSRDANFVANVLVPAVRTAGDLPTDTVGLLTGMTRSQDQQQALFALDTLNQLEQASPEAYQARVSDALASDVEYWRTVKDFLPADEVLDTVRGGATPESRQRRSLLQQEARKLLNDGTVTVTPMEQFVADLPRTLRAESGRFWGDPLMAPGIQNMLEKDFGTIFEREYGKYGNEEEAKKHTMESLKRIWNVTDIGGQMNLMRYPPELVGYKSWDGSFDWMTQQGLTDLNAYMNTVRGNDDSARPVSSFQLISDEQTKAEFQNWQSGGPAPSYAVVFRDEYGDLHSPEAESGRPYRLFFEVTPEMEADKVRQINQKKSDQDVQLFMNLYNRSLQHSLTYGTPIPQEIQDEYERLTEVSRPELTNTPPEIPEQTIKNLNLSPVEQSFLGALTAAENMGLGGTALKLYNDVIQRGRTSPITENDLSPEEQQALRQLVLDNANGKTSGTIDYKDYKNNNLDENILGGFSYRIEGNTVYIEDSYDFNADRADGSEDNIFVQVLALFAGHRNLAASIGRKKVSDLSGNGVPVKIKV